MLQHDTLGDGDCEAALAQAHRVLEDEFWVHRGCAHPMGGRGVLARMDRATDTLTVWSSTQMAHELHYTLALMLGQPEDRLRVVTPDVGGGFGAKIGCYSEELLLGVLSRAVGRPVRFKETRSESMTSRGHGRAQLQKSTVGGTRDGKVTHLRLELYQDSGGFCEIGTILGALFTRGMAAAVYGARDLFGQLTSWRMPLGFPLAALPDDTTPFVLAEHEVAFVGEAIAVVVADSRHIAEDAAARVAIEYEVLGAVVDCRDALRPDAPLFDRLAFAPIPFERIGLYRSPWRASWPVGSGPGGGSQMP